MADKINPIRETNDEARALARSLITDAVYASIGVLEPQTGYPSVSRIAVGVMPNDDLFEPMFLASDLSGHSKALALDERASIMFGEPVHTSNGVKGDPLASPRVTVIGTIKKITREHSTYVSRREFWLAKHPKAQIYIDFGDFNFYALKVERVALNGGFGKAFELTLDDLQAAT